MVDLTTDKQDNSNFITKVELNDDLETYTVYYADGHVDVKPFSSVHNFNVELYKMEQQYYQYRDSFNAEMHKWFLNTLKKSLIGLAVSIMGLLLTVNYVPAGLVKVLMVVLMILLSLGYELLQLRDFVTIGYSTSYLEDIEKFISIQNGLKVPVKDPKNGQDAEWYVANLSSINIGTDVSLYEKYAKVLQNPELKEEESKRLTKTLKGE